MQVGDIKNHKMNVGHNTCKTLTPVNALLNIFSLSYDVGSENNRKSHSYCRTQRFFLMGGVLGTASMFILYYKIRYLSNDLNKSVRLTDYVQSVYDNCQYVVDLVYVYKFGGNYYREYFIQYSAIDQIIGTGSCRAIRSRLNKLVTFYVLIWLTISLLDYAAWVTNYGWFIPTLYAIANIFFLLKILNNLDMTSQTMHIEIRLRIIADLVQSFYATTEMLPGVKCDSLLNNNWFYSNVNLRIKEREILKNYNRNCHEVKWLSRCYLLLTEQCCFINRMFGIRILLNCLSLLIDMVRFSNLAVRILTGSQQTQYESGYYFPVLSTISRIVACMVILISLVSHCERVYRQADRIIIISDHLLINKNPGSRLQAASTSPYVMFKDTELCAAISELRQLVQQRPISFHLANFFRLDNSMLLSTASVVVTYTIIILQSYN